MLKGRNIRKVESHWSRLSQSLAVEKGLKTLTILRSPDVVR